jgi:hypothetical protein
MSAEQTGKRKREEVMSIVKEIINCPSAPAA